MPTTIRVDSGSNLTHAPADPLTLPAQALRGSPSHGTEGKVPGEHYGKTAEFPHFDHVRLFAALAVLFGHSITVAQGGDHNDPLVRLFGEDSPTGTYAVCIFFVISGFLVTRSAMLRRSLPTFVAARVLRIFPALFVCQLTTSLILGGIFSHLSFGEYVARGYWWQYTWLHTLDPGMTWNVPTVAFYHVPGDLGVSFNASLWSIQQELVCYVVIAVLMACRLLHWPVLLALLLVTLPFLVPWERDQPDMLMDLVGWRFDQERLIEFLWVGGSFFAGAILYPLWRIKGAFPRWPLAVCAAILVGAWVAGRVYDAFPLYGAYPVLMFATASRPALPSLEKIGDLSYGIYLYGWPFQQTVRAVLGEETRWWQVFILAGIASALAAYASWHLIERPALALKRRLAGALQRPRGTTMREKKA